MQRRYYVTAAMLRREGACHADTQRFRDLFGPCAKVEVTEANVRRALEASLDPSWLLNYLRNRLSSANRNGLLTIRQYDDLRDRSYKLDNLMCALRTRIHRRSNYGEFRPTNMEVQDYTRMLMEAGDLWAEFKALKDAAVQAKLARERGGAEDNLALAA